VTFTTHAPMGKDTTVRTPTREPTKPRAKHARTTPPRPQREPTKDEDGTPLDRIETAFVLLSEQVRPPSIRLPASLLGGPPDEWVTPLVLRTRLMLRLKNNVDLWVDGEHISDRVWTYVAARARRQRGDWLTVAVALAMSKLREMVPYSASRRTEELVHSDLVYRLVTALAGDEYDADTEPPQAAAEAGTEPAERAEPAEPADTIGEPAGPPNQVPVSASATDFDIAAPYVFPRLIDRVHYAATRSPRRSSAPRSDVEFEEFESAELFREPDSHRLTRLQLGDPLIVLAEMVRDKKVSRLGAALIARTAVGGWTYPEAFAAIRATLPDEAGTQTDDALRGRLTRARQIVGKALRHREEINDVPGSSTRPQGHRQPG
jgi:hypothetical protein